MSSDESNIPPMHMLEGDSLQRFNPINCEEEKKANLKELQSSLKELQEIYGSMQQRLKDLEEIAEYSDIIDETIDWIYMHCEVDYDGNFKVGNTVYTWITFLKYIVTHKIDLTELKKNMLPKNENENENEHEQSISNAQ